MSLSISLDPSIRHTTTCVPGIEYRTPEIRPKTQFTWSLAQRFHKQVPTYHYPNDHLNHSQEAAMIFLYTIIDRIKDLFYAVLGKSNYYNQAKDQIDQKITPAPIVETSEITRIQNIGHATQLIQTNGLNILTDPVFKHLNALLYRRQSKPGITLEELPQIDVVIISHNHRDHMELETLEALIKKNPNTTFIVPKGELQRMQTLGAKNIRELSWWDKVTIEKTGKEKKVEIAAVPCRHWSNRGAFDASESLFNGYVITPLNADNQGNEAIYFAGDTARLDDVDLTAIGTTFNIAYNIQPSGPNFPRQYMQGTHQSTLDAIRTHQFFKQLNQDLKRTQKLVTAFMHHRTYRLGPDKFNETQTIVDFFLNNFPHSIPAIDTKYRPMFEEARSSSDSIMTREKPENHALINSDIGAIIESTQSR